jgi:hypothetical protein
MSVSGGVEAVTDRLEMATRTPGIQPLSSLRIGNENDQKDVVVGRVIIVAGPEVAAFDVSAKKVSPTDKTTSQFSPLQRL